MFERSAEKLVTFYTFALSARYFQWILFTRNFNILFMNAVVLN